MGSNMESFTYEPLDNEAEHIRVVKIRRSTPTIQLELQTVTLQYPENIPKYTALSYAWGDDQDTVSICVTTPSSPQPRKWPVTRNLHEALQHLHQSHGSKSLWIDAICIDQKNLREKSSQVSRMGLIYRFAEKVVAWIGPEKENSALVLDRMQYIASVVDVDWLTSSLRPSASATQDELRFAQEDEGYSLRIIPTAALISLFSRPYLERLWIRQEVAAQPENTTLRCGNATMTWEHFCAAAFIIHLKPNHGIEPSLEAEFDRQKTVAYRLCRLQPSRYLLDVLHASRVCHCSNARDRIYALLAIIRDADVLKISPQYDWTLTQTYGDAFMRYANVYKTLNMLAYCEPRDTPSELPTWIPTWTSGETRSVFRRSYSCLEICDLNPVLLNDRELLVNGVFATTIEDILPLPQDTTREQGILALRTLILRLNLTGSYVAGGAKIEAFLNSIYKEQWGTRWVPAPNSQSLENAISALRMMQDVTISDEEIVKYSSVLTLVAQFRSFCPGQALCISKDGHIGLVPLGAEVNDEIFTIPGCSWPMVLRRQPPSKQVFTVVGMCFLHGIMDNELLLCPLAPNYQSVRIAQREWADVDGPLVAFRHQATGRLRYTDPRLSHEELEEVEWFRASKLRERRPDEKPKTTIVQLKEQGVRLVDLHLV